MKKLLPLILILFLAGCNCDDCCPICPPNAVCQPCPVCPPCEEVIPSEDCCTANVEVYTTTLDEVKDRCIPPAISMEQNMTIPEISMNNEITYENSRVTMQKYRCPDYTRDLIFRDNILTYDTLLSNEITTNEITQ